MTPADKIELVLCDPTGLAEVYNGELKALGSGLALELTSTSIVRVGLIV